MACKSIHILWTFFYIVTCYEKRFQSISLWSCVVSHIVAVKHGRWPHHAVYMAIRQNDDAHGEQHRTSCQKRQRRFKSKYGSKSMARPWNCSPSNPTGQNYQPLHVQNQQRWSPYDLLVRLKPQKKKHFNTLMCFVGQSHNIQIIHTEVEMWKMLGVWKQLAVVFLFIEWYE